MALVHLFSRPNILFAFQVIVPLFILYVFCLAIYNRFFHPLRHFPGPFWASITSLWYARAVYFGRGQDMQLPIHKKYGPFVRLAPNLVQISDPRAIETIYEPKNGKVFRKGHFYDGFDGHMSKRRDYFSERDEEKHASRRRVVAPLYTQASVLSYEPCIDRLIEIFYRRMELFCKTQETADMSVWLKRYTFDVIGEIFYGRAGGFGMIRDNVDYNNWCLLLETMPVFASAMTYIPYGVQTLYFAAQMVSKQSRMGLKGFFDVMKQAANATQERLDVMEKGKDYNKNDVLSKLIDMVKDRGEELDFSIKDVNVELWMVIWAGSDTTAISLTSIFYHLHKYPETKRKLLDEIENAFATGALSYPVHYREASKLPYLQAVINEGLRIYPALGTGLPRVVPKGGATICGEFVPGNGSNIEVTMNPCAVHFDKGVFGEDAETWNPERWLRNGGKGVANMERQLLVFGHGPRVCIGKHITMTEMYKLLPTLLRDFDFEMLVDEWKVFPGWFQNQRDVNCKVTLRRPRDRPRPVLVAGAMNTPESIELTNGGKPVS